MGEDGGNLGREMRAKADAFAGVASTHGYELDYSWESLERLERLLDGLFATRNPLGRMRGKLSIRRFHRMVPLVGAYVGEVMRGQLGGEWSVNDEFGEPGVLIGPETWIFPVAKADKRFRNGHSDSLPFFADAMAAMVRT
jgi:hypothetical protein